MPPSKSDAEKIINALRQGTVPQRGLEHFAVGLDAPMGALRECLEYCGKGNGAYKFIRGPYGSGKTFLSSLLGSEAFDKKFLVSKVVVSPEVPLYKPHSLYRALCQNLSVAGQENGLSGLVIPWLVAVESQVIELEGRDEDSPDFVDAVGRRVETLLAGIAEKSGRMAQALRAFHRLRFQGEFAKANDLLDWLSADPHVSANANKFANIKGSVEADDVFPFLRGLLEIIRYRNKGLVLILDEVETQRRLRADVRKKGWESLRGWLDALGEARLPGLLLLATGTPELFDAPNGIREHAPLHQRIYVDFSGEGPPNYLQAQIPLPPFDRARLLLVGARVRDIYRLLAKNPDRVEKKVTTAYLDRLADAFGEHFKGRFSVTPRLFLRRLVDVLDRVDREESFDLMRDGGVSESWIKELGNEEELGEQ